MIWMTQKKNNSVFGCPQDRRYYYFTHQEYIIPWELHHILGSSIILDDTKLLYNYISKPARYDWSSTTSSYFNWVQHMGARSVSGCKHICPQQNDSSWRLLVGMWLFLEVPEKPLISAMFGGTAGAAALQICLLFLPLGFPFLNLKMSHITHQSYNCILHPEVLVCLSNWNNALFACATSIGDVTVSSILVAWVTWCLSVSVSPFMSIILGNLLLRPHRDEVSFQTIQRFERFWEKLKHDFIIKLVKFSHENVVVAQLKPLWTKIKVKVNQGLLRQAASSWELLWEFTFFVLNN